MTLISTASSLGLYAALLISATFTALAGTPQSISFPVIDCQFTGGPSFTLNASASSGLVVTYSLAAGGETASLSGNILTPGAAAGVVTIKASQGGDAIYEAAADVYSSFFVQPASRAWKSIAQGSEFTIAVRMDGTLWSWGDNNLGQLGTGSGPGRSVPTQVGTAGDWMFVSASYRHVLALKNDNSLWSWGDNSERALGIPEGTAGDGPFHVAPGATWRSVSASSGSSMGVQTDGSLWGWGYNGVTVNGVVQSLLGDGTTIRHRTPTRIGTANNWKSVELGRGIKTDGSYWAWGDNYAGALGDGTTIYRNTPVQVGSGTNWKMVARSRGIKTDGTFWAWGSNYNGTLGDGTTIDRPSPVQLGTATDWLTLASGQGPTRAIKANGTLWAWGNNGGAIGDGTTLRRTTPVQVGTENNWTGVAGDNYHTAATRADGSLWAWGDDHNGPLSYGDPGMPRLHESLGPVKLCVTNNGAGFCLKTDGSLWAWGLNSGKLGDGTTTNRPLPVPIAAGVTWRGIESTQNKTFAIRSDGTLWGWGAGGVGDGTSTLRLLPVQIGTAADWKLIKAGGGRGFAIKENGTLWGWGDGAEGALGDGTANNRLSPVQIGTATDWMQVSTGSYRTMGIRSDGTLWAWGNNAGSSLGDGTTTNRLSPVQIGISTDWSSVSVGYDFAVALKSNGSLWNWGKGVSLTAPQQVGTATDWIAAKTTNNGVYEEWTGSLSVRGNHSLALKADGTLWSWGANSLGELGTGNNIAQLQPAQVGTSTAWSSISCSGYSNLCLSRDGSIWGFGENPDELLGPLFDHTRPIRVLPTFVDQTITFPPVTATVGERVTLQATASSGLPVSYGASGPAVLDGNHLTVSGPGEINLVAYQKGDSCWRATGPVKGAVTILPAGDWDPTGSLSGGRRSHSATLLGNGKVLVVGGRDNSGAGLATAELYDPVSGTWTLTGSLAHPRHSHASVLLPSGKVLVCGGSPNLSGGMGIVDTEIYDPATGTWSGTGSLAAARFSHTATLLPNGKVLVCGGRNNTFSAIIAAELYDPLAGTWNSAGNLVSPRFFHSASLLGNGKVLVAGGSDGATGSELAQAEWFDPATGLWTATGSLGTRRRAHTATVLADGKVLVAGGLSDFFAHASAELFDPTTGSWTVTGVMAAACNWHTANLMSDGSVLLTGGLPQANGLGLATTQRYSPASGTWSHPVDLTIGRGYHTATLLPAGKLLVAGGSTGFDAINSAELYDPAGIGDTEEEYFNDWATIAGLNLADATPDAIPFKDGVPNLLKYAFNMNAAGPDVSVLTAEGFSGLPQVMVDQSGEEPVLRVEFLRRIGSGLIYTPQRSDTLGTFVTMTGTQTVTSIDAQWERVSVEESAPPAAAPSAFARVQVKLP